jgi:hypothetical protein
MKPVLLALPALTLGALPALAHGGAHLHPHGSELPLGVLLAALGAAALAGWLAARSR